MAAPELQPLIDTVLRILRAHPDGIPEQKLIRELDAEGIPPFAGAVLSETLELFRCHFLLFHCLYRLRDQVRSEGAADLNISPLAIVLLPYAEGEGGSAIAGSDPLRDYYLDLSHLDGTTEQDVNQLLDGFFRRRQALDERGAALAELGLDDGTSFEAARRRYRKLVMEHHPDRGGDTERLQALNRAMDVLERSYGR